MSLISKCVFDGYVLGPFVYAMQWDESQQVYRLTCALTSSNKHCTISNQIDAVNGARMKIIRTINITQLQCMLTTAMTSEKTW
jgi:hypothetical protein